MAKTNASFKLSKSTKRVMSTILSKSQRTIFKHSMVEAEWDYVHKRHARPRDNQSSRESAGTNSE